MKKLVIAMFTVLFLTSGVSAVERRKPKPIFVECRSPLDLVMGVGVYACDLTGKVVHGVGAIVTAPFRARMCLPKRRTYMYRRPQLRWRYVPGELKELPGPTFEELPPIEVTPTERSGPVVHPLHFPIPPLPSSVTRR